MKLIKKIAAIMLSIMVVLGMASVVSAEGTTTSGTSTTGTITISKVAPGATYKIYRILDLESYSGNNYAYKLREETPSSPWKAFIESQTDYVDIDNGYVTWKAGQDVKVFAKLALERANKTNDEVTPDGTQTVPANAQTASTSIVFSNLTLGYYLIDSGAGTLCLLNTTNPNINIEEKNDVPSVEKKVQEDSKIGTADEWGKNNTADIGQIVNFQTTITAQLGAQNYVLHDKMDAGLTFGGIVTVKKGDTILATPNDYSLITDAANITDGCTFEIAFTQAFCNTLVADDQIIVTYSATLNNDVESKKDYKNETWLKYGVNSETNHDTTTTKTFKLPVFKYTMKNSTETGLASAIFTLSKNSDGSDPIKLVSDGNDPTAGNIYRVAKTGDVNTVTTVTTPASGKFTIKGLDADTYYLTETKQPDGYNKLSAPITVVIDENGNITVDRTTVDEVRVENKTGSLLPSTGGSGTTMIYILGAILVLGSSVVLITKKRMR